jgi:hypothetical protein
MLFWDLVGRRFWVYCSWPGAVSGYGLPISLVKKRRVVSCDPRSSHSHRLMKLLMEGNRYMGLVHLAFKMEQLGCGAKSGRGTMRSER